MPKSDSEFFFFLKELDYAPAFCFSLNAISSSSISFFSFLGALRGFAFPPEQKSLVSRLLLTALEPGSTFSAITTHRDVVLMRAILSGYSDFAQNSLL